MWCQTKPPPTTHCPTPPLRWSCAWSLPGGEVKRLERVVDKLPVQLALRLRSQFGASSEPGTEEKLGWTAQLVTDDFGGYKACFELGATEVGCMAHARRKFHELWANHGSQVGEQALKFFAKLYEVEREIADLDAEHRRETRQRRSRPVVNALHQWLVLLRTA